MCRAGEAPSTGLTEALVGLGFETDRLKTGTPARVDSRTVDFSGLEAQPGDPDVRWFSFDSSVCIPPHRAHPDIGMLRCHPCASLHSELPGNPAWQSETFFIMAGLQRWTALASLHARRQFCHFFYVQYRERQCNGHVCKMKFQKFAGVMLAGAC